MSWGLEKKGFKTLAAIDNWDIALKTFKRNHPKSKIYLGDIQALDPKKIMTELGIKPGELSCIVGGPPCQGFSRNVPARYRFLQDPRNQLFKEYLRFVKVMQPKVVVMENVAEIYNSFDGAVKNEIVNSLQKLGYEVSVKVLFAPDYGVPQRRKRCFFFAARGVKPSFPAPSHCPDPEKNLLVKNKFVSAWEAISDLPSLVHGQGEFEMEYNSKPKNQFQSTMRKGVRKLYNHIARELREKQYKRICSLAPGQAYKDLPPEIRPKSGYSGAYGRLDYKMVAPTITRWVFHLGSGRYGHPSDDRLITMREAARLQSFSDDFIFEGTYTQIAGQIGNAVPPLLMSAMADEIIEILDAQ